MSDKLRVGLIGVGMMGKPMARRVMAAGFPLTIHDIRPEAVQALVAQGARQAGSPREIAAACDVVLTSLPSLAACEEVYLGNSGLLKGARPGEILVETSTVPPSLVKRFADEARKQGVAVMDASLKSGAFARPDLAGLKSDEIIGRGVINVLVGGEPEQVEKVKPVLSSFGLPMHLGPIGSGALVKVLANAISHAEFVSTCEVFAVAAKAGVNLQNLLETFAKTGPMNSTISDTLPRLLRTGKGKKMRTEAGVKDCESMLQVGRELGVPLLIHSMTHYYYEWAQTQGLKDRPWDEMLKLWEGVIGKPMRL
ncbi:MAG: NAD(P)-dependent oxidoreductase [Chloroflexi bacterium]|nr:NAD(P)-dependent oxidoreductase [Chloroflexota bacterium]